MLSLGLCVMFHIEPHQIESFEAIFLGFALAGVTASAFQMLTDKQLSFRMLQSGGVISAVFLPLIAVSAPVIILRNSARGRRFEKRSVHMVAFATIIACFWSMFFGRLLMYYMWG
jgi:hypothetical protein